MNDIVLKTEGLVKRFGGITATDYVSLNVTRGARHALIEHGVSEQAIDLVRVPGAWEIPAVAAKLAAAGQHGAILALGCVVRGDTRHYEHVADGCAE